MSLENMTKAVVKQKITDLYNTIFVQKWVFLPKEVKDLIENIDDQPIEILNDLSKAIFASRYRAVHDIAISLNELLETYKGEINMTVTKDVEWQGYVNGTEEPVTVHLTKGTEINLLEFLEAPHEGFIFQLCLGEGPDGKHFNVNMDNAFPYVDSLVEFINQAYNERLIDKELGIDDDFYLGEITDEVKAKLEAKYGEIKEFVPAPPLSEHEAMEITEVKADGAE